MSVFDEHLASAEEEEEKRRLEHQRREEVGSSARSYDPCYADLTRYFRSIVSARPRNLMNRSVLVLCRIEIVEMIGPTIFFTGSSFGANGGGQEREATGSDNTHFLYDLTYRWILSTSISHTAGCAAPAKIRGVARKVGIYGSEYRRGRGGRSGAGAREAQEGGGRRKQSREEEQGR